MRRITSIIFVLMLLLTLFMHGSDNGTVEGVFPEDMDFITPPDEYRKSPPVRIETDEELLDFKLTHDLRGNGTDENPILIQKMAFENRYEEPGLDIHDTELHLIVRDCFFYTRQGEEYYFNNDHLKFKHCSNVTVENCRFYTTVRDGIAFYKGNNVIVRNNYIYSIDHDDDEDRAHGCGIDIINVDDVIVENNTVLYGAVGLSLCGKNIMVRNNTISNSYDGFYGFSLRDSEVSNNRFIDCTEATMHFSWSWDLKIEDNFCEGRYGIGLIVTSNIGVERNIVHSEGSVMFIQGAFNHTYRENNLKGSGIAFKSYYSRYRECVFEDNLLNNKPIVFIQSAHSEKIELPDSVGQLIIMNSTNLELDGIELEGMGNNLVIGYCTNITLTYFRITSNYSGIRCMDSEDVRFRKGYLNCTKVGIEMEGSSDVLISECTFERTYLAVNGIDSNRIEVANNSIESGNYSILMTNVEQGEIFGNRDDSDYGLFIMESDGVEITNNSFSTGRIYLDEDTILYGDQPEPVGNLYDGREIVFLINREEMIYTIDREIGGLYLLNVRSSLIHNISIVDGPGIEVWQCSRTAIHSANLSGTEIGIKVKDCDETYLIRCTIENSLSNGGINISGSRDCAVDNCTLNDNRNGIFVNNSDTIFISSNIIINSSVDGINVLSESRGLYINGNLIMDSGRHGVNISMTFRKGEIVVMNNTVAGSKGYGLMLTTPDHSSVRNNNFIDNNGTTDRYNETACQIRYNGISGLYAVGSHCGNYWHDLDDETRKYLVENFEPPANFDHDNPIPGDQYPLERPSSGCPRAPGYEEVWRPPPMERKIDYSMEFMVLVIGFIILLFVPFLIRARALNKRDISRKHERYPWTMGKKADPVGRRTPTTLRKPDDR